MQGRIELSSPFTACLTVFKMSITARVGRSVGSSEGNKDPVLMCWRNCKYWKTTCRQSGTL